MDRCSVTQYYIFSDDSVICFLVISLSGSNNISFSDVLFDQGANVLKDYNCLIF